MNRSSSIALCRIAGILWLLCLRAPAGEQGNALAPLSFVTVRGEYVLADDVPRSAALEVTTFLNLLSLDSENGILRVPGDEDMPAAYPYPTEGEHKATSGGRFCHIILGTNAPAFFIIGLRTTNPEVHRFLMRTACRWYEARTSIVELGNETTEGNIRRSGRTGANWEDCIRAILPMLSTLDDYSRSAFWAAVGENFSVYYYWPSLFQGDERYNTELLDALERAMDQEPSDIVKKNAAVKLRFIRRKLDERQRARKNRGQPSRINLTNEKIGVTH